MNWLKKIGNGLLDCYLKSQNIRDINKEDFV